MTLILYSDGDIAILHNGESVYHKSFNPGEHIDVNLLEAYHVYEEMCEQNDGTTKKKKTR